MQVETEAEVWAEADAAVFRLLQGANRTARRSMAAERTIAAAHRRVDVIRRMRAARADREQAAANRRLQRVLDEAWGRPIRVRQAQKVHGMIHDKPRRALVAKPKRSRRALKTYAAPLIDARGRVALYFAIKYVGLKSKKWRPGLSAAHAKYILRDGALEQVGDGAAPQLQSNMGETVEEVAAAWTVIEEMEQGYRSNATVQHRIVWNLPHDLDPEQRRALVQHFCERTFGRLGLPWTAAIHKPDAGGDERNYHAHIIFSTRPCERTGDHEWEFAQEKITDLTNPAGLKLMRALAAAHMNLACRAAGKVGRFSHQTYQERNIDAVRQIHVGPERMAAYDRGEQVAVIEQNARIVERNETAMARDMAARGVALAGQLAALIGQGVDIAARRAGLSALRMKVASIAAQSRDIGSAQAEHRAARLPAFTAIAARARALQAARLAPVRQMDSGRPRALVAALMEMRERREAHALSKAALIQARQQLARSQQALSDAVLAHEANQAAAVAERRAREQAALERAATLAAAKAQADAEHAARQHRVLQHEMQVEEACRILRKSKQRPYRRLGIKILPDLTMLDEAERALIAKIGFAEPRLEATLLARVKQDRVDDHRAHSLDVLYRTIREERHYLSQENGQRIVPPVLLDRLRLTPAMMSGHAVQQQLSRIATEQAGEHAQIIQYAQASPQDIVWQDQRWVFSDAAPAAVRVMAEAWRDDALMQSILQSSVSVPEASSNDRNDRSLQAGRHEGAGRNDPPTDKIKVQSPRQAPDMPTEPGRVATRSIPVKPATGIGD